MLRTMGELDVLRKMNFQIVQLSFVGLVALALLFVPAFHSTGTVLAQDQSVIEPSGEQPTLDQIAYALNFRADDMSASYNIINHLACTKLDATDLGGKTFRAGVYCLSSAQLAGELVLDAQGDAGSTFIFRVAGALTTKGGSTITLANDAMAANVHFVADTAIVGGGTNFKPTLREAFWQTTRSISKMAQPSKVMYLPPSAKLLPRRKVLTASEQAPWRFVRLRPV